MPSLPLHHTNHLSKSAADRQPIDLDKGQNSSSAKPGFLHRALATCRAIVRQRCPRCHQGKMFSGSFAMNDPCPCCGLLFQREEGYFLGAMYMSYPITSAILIPIYFALSELLPNWHSLLLVPVATALYLPFMPAVFRYSRVLWIYFDRMGDPYDPSFLTSYEKTRLEEFADSKAEAPLDRQKKNLN